MCILRRAEDSFARATFVDLKRGLRVTVWSSGPIAESCPGQQAGADVILLR